MRSALNAISGRCRFLTGLAAGLGVGVAGVSMLGMTPPTGVYVTDGNQVLLYTPRVVDPWKVIGITSSVNDGRTTLYRLYENGAIDYLTPNDGPRTSLGVATWTPIPIDPNLIRVRTP